MPSPNAWEKLVVKKWDELEALELEGRLFWPEVIRTRGKGGKVTEIPVMLRVLRKDERRKARLDAIESAGALKIDREKDPDLFDDLDTLCILARAIRDREPPYVQHMKAEDLGAKYDERSLAELWGKYRVYEDLTDPRDALLTETQFWAAVGALGKVRDIRPLTEYESLSQNAFILRLVDLALTSPTFNSWFTSFESSTPAP